MYQRRSQSDSKSTQNPTTGNPNSAQHVYTNSSVSSSTRVSIYSMRERVINHKITNMMTKLTPNAETEVTSRLHQEVPAVSLDGHLAYSLYFTMQNFIHIHSVYLFIYYAFVWSLPKNINLDDFHVLHIIERTLFEETYLINADDKENSYGAISINTKSINSKVYVTLLGLSSFELVSAFLWTLKKKLPFYIQRYSRIRSYLGIFLFILIGSIYTSLLLWIVIQTWIEQTFSHYLGICMIVHMLILVFLDKPNLLRKSSYQFSKNPLIVRQVSQNSSSNLAQTNSSSRSFNRTLSSLQNRKLNSMLHSYSSWSRWSSITEDLIELHDCSFVYAQSREEADRLWVIVKHRFSIVVYRTLSSTYFLHFIPVLHMNPFDRDIHRPTFVVITLIFFLTNLISHSSFMFPIKLQTTLHRIAAHLGQWRSQNVLSTETIPEWSPDSNSYTRGSIVKLPLNRQKQFLAMQHIQNAADPRSNSHAILYRVFSDPSNLLNFQLILVFALFILTIGWIINGPHWPATMIVSLVIFSNSYPTFKIIRDRVIIDFIEQNNFDKSSVSYEQNKSD